jgi:ligand-binding SRPBCC domain-containing protein
MKLKFENEVTYPFEFVVAHVGKEMFLAMNPPWSGIEVQRFDGVKVSDEVHLKIKLGPVEIPWISKIVLSELKELEFQFIDIGVKMLPGMKSWHHQHIFRKIDENKTLIIDDVKFESGNFLLDLFFRNIMTIQFLYRRYAYSKFLKSCH